MTPHLADIPEIETERLRLRAPRASDYEPFVAFRMSERALGVGGPYTRTEAFDQFGELFGHWVVRGFGRWLVADRQTDEALGVVGLLYPPDWPEPEIAWAVFENGEGRGIAFEAATASRTYAYDKLGWRRVVSLIVPSNSRSIELAKRMGAIFEAPYQHPTIGPMQIWCHLGPEALR